MSDTEKPKWYDDSRKVGKRLRAARDAAGLTQRDLAGPYCTAAYVSLIEKGERVPSLQMIRGFAETLGVSDEFIANGRTESAPARTVGVAEARVAVRLGELEVAERLADVALGAARSDRERASASAVFGEVALIRGDYDKAVETLERARQLDDRIEEREPDVAEALGRSYARRLEYPASAAVFERALDRARNAGDLPNVVRFSSLLANAYTDAANFPAAEAALVEALKAADGLDDPLARARTLWAQSRLYAHQHDSDTAARYAERALEILQVSDYDYFTALAHQLLAHIELDRGNGERAAELLEAAAPFIAESARPFETASFQVEHARALMAVGRNDEAASVALAAAGALVGQSSIDAGRCYLLVGDAFKDMEEPERAVEMYELAVEIFEELPSRFLVEGYSKLAAMFEARGDEKRALDVLKKAMRVQENTQRMLTPRA